jgi:hypothetical protein
MSGTAPKQNAVKSKIAPHKQKSILKTKFGRKMPSPQPASWLTRPCTPKKNDKSGTDVNLAGFSGLSILDFPFGIL